MYLILRDETANHGRKVIRAGKDESIESHLGATLMCEILDHLVSSLAKEERHIAEYV